MDTPKAAPHWVNYCQGFEDAGADCGLIISHRTTLDGRPLPAPIGQPWYAAGYRAGLDAVANRRWHAGPCLAWKVAARRRANSRQGRRARP